jgi:plasmid stabilization system protein ParE
VKIIRLTAAARSEFLKEVSYYEAIQKGLGSRFRKAVTVAFQKSAEFPLHGKPGVADTRRILVDGFPFAVVYIVEDTGILVHAVAHLSRKPRYWLERLGNES